MQTGRYSSTLYTVRITGLFRRKIFRISEGRRMGGGGGGGGRGKGGNWNEGGGKKGGCVIGGGRYRECW